MSWARHDARVTKRRLSILERPVYGIAEAAALLGLRPDRTRAWLDGYERQGVRYSPVIRPESTRDDVVTWGEFVELGYLREYRRKGVPLQRLRPVIDELRRGFETPYPLATAKPYIFGKELVLEVQERNDLPSAIPIVIRSGQQILLADGATASPRRSSSTRPSRVTSRNPPGGVRVAGGDRSAGALWSSGGPGRRHGPPVRAVRRWRDARRDLEGLRHVRRAGKGRCFVRGAAPLTGGVAGGAGQVLR